MKTLVSCMAFTIAGFLWSAQGWGGDSGITVLQPLNGTTVTPSQSVPIRVQVDGSLLPGVVLVWAGSADDTRAIELSGPPFEGSITVPATASGPYVLSVDVSHPESVGIVASADDITLNVVPGDAPLSLDSTGLIQLSLPNPVNPLDLQIHVKGIYAGAVERDITVMGTSYASLTPSVVSVDGTGRLTPLAPGYGFIEIQNGGAKTYTEVIVRGPDGAPPNATDASSSGIIHTSGFQKDADTGLYVQEISFENTGTMPIPKAIYFLVRDLSAGVSVQNAVGTTRTASPVGLPFVRAESDQQFFIRPGEAAKATVRFRNPDAVPITYNTRVYAGGRP